MNITPKFLKDLEYKEAESISYIMEVMRTLENAWQMEAIDDFRYKRIMIELANQIIFEYKKEADQA